MVRKTRQFFDRSWEMGKVEAGDLFHIFSFQKFIGGRAQAVETTV